MTATSDLFVAAAKTHGIEGVDFTEPANHDVMVRGLRFHYVDWGGDGQPVLFLHGGGQTARTWDLVCVQIRKQYRCYALDQRNHGDTDKASSTENDRAEMCEDVRAFVEAIGLDRFVLVGMSMGGANTMAYASKYPERLRAVVIVDVTPTVRQEGVRQISDFNVAQEFASVEEALERAVQFNPARPRAHLHYSLIHALRQRPDGRWVWKRERLPQERKETTAEQWDKMRAVSELLWDEVPKIPCPTLVVHGGDSKVIHREHADRLARTIPNATAVTIPGAGHTVQGDRPKEFVAALTGFLDRVL